MNSKQINYKAKEEDIRPIVKNIVQLVFARFQRTINKNAESIGLALSSGDGLDIISKVEQFITDAERSLTEFENICDIASLVGEPSASEDLQED
jgi:hypothetical protein